MKQHSFFVGIFFLEILEHLKKLKDSWDEVSAFFFQFFFLRNEEKKEEVSEEFLGLDNLIETKPKACKKKKIVLIWNEEKENSHVGKIVGNSFRGVGIFNENKKLTLNAMETLFFISYQGVSFQLIDPG